VHSGVSLDPENEVNMFAKISVSVDGKKRHRTQAFPGFFPARKKIDKEAKTVNRLFSVDGA